MTDSIISSDPTEILKDASGSTNSILTPHIMNPLEKIGLMQYLPLCKQIYANLNDTQKDEVYDALCRFAPDLADTLLSLIETPEDKTAKHKLKSKDDGDDEREEKEFIPDKEILDEIIEYAITLHFAGHDWAQISDLIYQKYDVDWHFQRVKNIVLKKLAWQSRAQVYDIPNDIRKTSKEKDNEDVREKEEKEELGIIRKLFKKLW